MLCRKYTWIILTAMCIAYSTTSSIVMGVPPQHEASQVLHGYLSSPKAFRAAADTVLPSLVSIESIGGIAISPGAKVGRRTRSSGISKPGEGPTTGLIVSKEGHIITSTFNFIKNPPIITVTLHDGSQYVAKMLGRDNTRKICLLKIDADKPLPLPEIAPRDELKVGQWAISLGVGYGDSDPAMSAGIISATHRISNRAVQTDANISPANYGGPLIDITGRVIGICSPLSPSRGGPTPPQRPGQQQGPNPLAGVEWYDSGIGFAVPLDGAQRIIEKLKRGETISRGLMGIRLKADKNGGGAIVADVADKSAAARAGLKKDDLIVSADGENVLDVMHLQSLVGRFSAGDEVSISIKRGDKTLDLKVTLSAVDAAAKDKPPAKKPATPKKESEQP